MNWHYVDQGQQAGPINDEELARLAAEGKIRDETLVWHSELPNWIPFRDVRPAEKPPVPPTPPPAAAPNLPGPGQVLCAECGKVFPQDDTIPYGNVRICAGCKPILMQKLAEGAPTMASVGIWREGKRMVARSETVLPDRCVKCNAPAGGFRLKRTLYWHHPAYFLLLFCNILILLIVVMIVRKKAVLHIGLCEVHQRQRQTAIAACCIGLLAGLAMIIIGAARSSGVLAAAGTGLFLLGAGWGLAKGRTVTPVKIENDTAWVTGVCKEFLAQLPERAP